MPVRLIALTSFNPLDPMADEKLEIDANQVVSIVPTKTGDGHNYTTVGVGEALFFVKETVQQVTNLVSGEAA